MEYNIFNINPISFEHDLPKEWNKELLVINETPLSNDSLEALAKLTEALNISSYEFIDNTHAILHKSKIPLNAFFKLTFLKQIWFFGDVNKIVEMSIKVPNSQKFNILGINILASQDFNQLINNKASKVQLWKELQFMKLAD